MYEAKLNFLGGGVGGGVQNKNLPWGEYGYFVELFMRVFFYKNNV